MKGKPNLIDHWLVSIRRNYHIPWGEVCDTKRMNQLVQAKGKDRITVEYLGKFIGKAGN